MVCKLLKYPSKWMTSPSGIYYRLDIIGIEDLEVRTGPLTIGQFRPA